MAPDPAVADSGPLVRIARLVIDPARLPDWQDALRRQVAAAVRDEPGVLALHAVADPAAPDRVQVFEIYRDEAAYRSHLGAPHFLAYKAAVQGMVLSLELSTVTPVALGAKALDAGRDDG